MVHRWRARSLDRQHVVWRGAGVVRASLTQWVPFADNSSGRSSFLERATQPQRVGVLAQSSDAERDVLFERHSKLFGAFTHVLARDALGEELVVHATLHRLHFQIQNTLRRTHVSACRKEASDLIASEEGVLQRRL